MRKPVAVLLAVFAASAGAHDLGVWGEAHEIIEPDIRAVMMDQISKIDLKKHEKDLTEKTNNYGKSLPDYTLPIIRKTRTYYVKPEVTATENIYSPTLNEEGELEWVVLVPKGTKANPLDKVRPNTAYMIIDGNSKEQVEFMQAVWRAAPNYIIPMLSSGDPIALAKKMKTPIYRASPFIMERLDLDHTPAIARSGEGKNKNKIAVTEFARPFTLQRTLAELSLKQLFSKDTEAQKDGQN